MQTKERALKEAIAKKAAMKPTLTNSKGRPCIVKGKRQRAYVVWRGMIYRCYDAKSLERLPNYLDTTVDERWWDYSEFYDWYVKQPGAEKGWHLDKDLFLYENTVYGPETCILLPKAVNEALAYVANFPKKDKELPPCIYKVKNGYKLKIRNDIFETFPTVEEAFIWLCARKQISLKGLMDQFGLNSRIQLHCLHNILQSLGWTADKHGLDAMEIPILYSWD